MPITRFREKRDTSPEYMGLGREMNHNFLFPHLSFKAHVQQTDSKLTITLSLGFCFVYLAPKIERSSVPLKKEGKIYAKYLVLE